MTIGLNDDSFGYTERLLLIVRAQLEDHLNGYPDSELYESLPETLARVKAWLEKSGLEYE